MAVIVGTLSVYKWTVGEMREVARQERDAAELRETRRSNPYVFPFDGGP